MGLTGPQIEAAIGGLLARRAPGATICPSEAARALDPEGWRAHMDAVRAVAFGLADRGELEVTQGGEVVDGRAARGPIRLRLPAGPDGGGQPVAGSSSSSANVPKDGRPAKP